MPLFSTVSSPQKLATPTFQVPACLTATPLRLDSTGWPPSRIVYVTLACDGETTVTLVTFAVAEEARPEPAWDLMTDANVCPSWRRLTRLATGVLGLKNASQFAVIAAVSPALLTGLAEVTGAEEVAGADDDGAELGLELAPELELLLPLEHAAMPAASAQTSRICWGTLRATIQLFSNFWPPAATQQALIHDVTVRLTAPPGSRCRSAGQRAALR